MEKTKHKALTVSIVGAALCLFVLLICVAVFQICNLKKIERQTKILDGKLDCVVEEKTEKQEEIKILEKNSFTREYALIFLGLADEDTFKFVAEDENK